MGKNMNDKLNAVLDETKAGSLLSRDERLFVESLMVCEYDWDFCYDKNAIQLIKQLFFRYQKLIDDVASVMHSSFCAEED